jgi:hypothetical protein
MLLRRQGHPVRDKKTPADALRLLVVGAIVGLLAVPSADANSIDSPNDFFTIRSLKPAWSLDWASCRDELALPAAGRAFTFSTTLLDQDTAQPLHPVAIQHSDAYLTRAKIHKVASFATLPLFAAELVLGSSLYSGSGSSGTKTAHIAVGVGIVGLFGVNTVTGAWNMFGEGWEEKDGRTLRLVHGLMMMAADVGFLATSATGPNSGGRRGALTFETDKATHRNIAVASISIATASYLLMVFGNR